MKNEVEIGGVKIGENYPSVLLPEIGVLFKQDLDQARQSIQEIKSAGCTIIKGECYHDIDIVADDGFEYEYRTHAGVKVKLSRLRTRDYSPTQGLGAALDYAMTGMATLFLLMIESR